MGELLLYGRKAQPRGYANGFDRYPQFNIFFITSGELVAAERDIAAARQPPIRIRAGRFLVLPPGSGFDLSTPSSAYRGHFTEARPAACSLPPRLWIGAWGARVGATIADIEREHDEQPDASVLPLLYEVLFHRAIRQVQAALRPDTGPDDLPALVDSRLRAHVFTAAEVGEILAPLPWSLRQPQAPLPRRLRLLAEAGPARLQDRRGAAPVGRDHHQHHGDRHRPRLSEQPALRHPVQGPLRVFAIRLAPSAGLRRPRALS